MPTMPPVFMSAAAGIVGMGEKRRGSRRHDRRRLLLCRRIPKACRSTCWSKSRVRRWLRAAHSIRSISCAPSRSPRITMPKSMVRLSAGREDMSEETQGAMLPRRRQFYLLRSELLTTANPAPRSRSAIARKARARADGLQKSGWGCFPTAHPTRHRGHPFLAIIVATKVRNIKGPQVG